MRILQGNLCINQTNVYKYKNVYDPGMRNVQVSKTVWRSLNKIKKEKGYRVFNQVIKDFVEEVDREESKTLSTGKAMEEVKPDTGPPAPPKVTPTSGYNVANDLEKSQYDLEKLRNEDARAELDYTRKEYQQVITNRIHSQESYKNAMKEMARTKEIFGKEIDDFHSKLDEATQMINNLKSRKIA